jgi:carboxyl-terminal processing protease
MRRRLALALLVMVLAPCGCAEEDTPLNNFERLWWDFDMRYAQFDVKHIDWDAVYDEQRPQVRDDMSDAALFDVLADMLAAVYDNHATLYGNGAKFQSGSLAGQPMEDFDLELAKAYLDDPHKAGAGNFTYGTIDGRIGYLHIAAMSADEEGWTSDIDKVLARLEGVEAMIVDIRDNPGGNDLESYAIAARFADKKRLAMKTSYRDGPAHDDLGPVKEWYVEPKGPRQFTGPTLLLTHLHSVSAAETFSLAMLELPHVTQLGSTTSGAFANNVPRELLNGWVYTLPIGLFLDADDRCWEGIGLAPLPENQIKNTKEDIEAGVDVVLETAIARLSD